MIAFKVTINGEYPVIGGVEKGVASAIFSHRTARGSGDPADTEFTLGGLDTSDGDESVVWKKANLQVGDKILVEIVELEEVDEAIERRRDLPEVILDAKLKYFEKLKKELGK